MMCKGSPFQTFSASNEEYYAMLDYVMESAARSGMSEKQKMRLELGFEEAASNVINYAYGERADGKIHVSAYRDGEKFFVEIKDSGEPFNPLDVEEKNDQPTTLEDAKVGGLGISFMRRIFDEMTYHYGKDGELFFNRLTLGMKLT